MHMLKILISKELLWLRLSSCYLEVSLHTTCVFPCRNVKKQQDIGELMQYLEQVHVTVEAFERRLWRHVRNYHALALQQPGLLVDCARIVELQEQMDAHYARTKATWVRAKHFKERSLLEMEASVRQRWAPVLALAGQYGEQNTRVSGEGG